MAMEDRFAGHILPDGEAGRRPTMGEIGLNHFAPYLLNRIASRWNADMSEMLKAHDMTTTKMRTLAILSISPSLTINELAVYAVTEQSTLSRTLDGLQEQGFIRRTPRAGDLRVRDVSLTEAGRLAFERIWPGMYERFSHLCDGIEEEEYRAFLGTLHKLLRNIRKHDL